MKRSPIAIAAVVGVAMIAVPQALAGHEAKPCEVEAQGVPHKAKPDTPKPSKPKPPACPEPPTTTPTEPEPPATTPTEPEPPATTPTTPAPPAEVPPATTPTTPTTPTLPGPDKPPTCTYLLTVGAGQRWLDKYGCTRPPISCAKLKAALANGAGPKWRKVALQRGCIEPAPRPPMNPEEIGVTG